jgi:phosphopantetheinyl transferase
LPLFYQHTINATTQLAIWHITEDAYFFLEKVPLSRQITHPHKRLQHLAGRYLLQYLFPHFPIDLIQIADTRKPYLEAESHHFSISHCGNYAAAIVSTTQRVGIDIEIPTDRILKIKNKFLSVQEQHTLNAFKNDTPTINILTAAWSVKEAVFKWYGLGEMDFRTDMVIAQNTPTHFTINFNKNGNQQLGVNYTFFAEMVLSYLAT